jgi:hypothetical protein
MDDLRREVNKAFDQRQSQLGDLEGARERMIHRALGARTSEPANRMQLAAGLAAILIAALVIATFAYIRAGSQPTSGKPVGGIPNTTPLILYHDPANPDQIDGITWDGRTSGHIGRGGTAGGTSNPAGTLYATATDIRDRTGEVVGPLANASVNAFHVTWADDELHYCQVVPASYKGVGPGPGMLQLVWPGKPPSNIAQIGIYPAASENRLPPAVAGCSVEGDRAVVFQMAFSAKLTAQVWVWVIQLSTGRILWAHLVQLPWPTGGLRVVSTHDGRLVAVTTLSTGPSASTIYGSDGSVVTHLATDVDAFSWDGSLAVISPSSGGPVALMRWRDKTVLWSGPVGFHFREVRSEPGGGRVAIGLTDINSADTATVRLVNLYVISAGGQVVWHKDNVYLA